ncbi:MAG: hypothetical protein LC650_02065 [Actinobacteria bacterium]|nr:hypothetical protein [Actinomycetota bacterium]
MTQKMTDLVKQITSMLTAVLLFLGALGYSFEKFNPSTIEALGIVLTALIPLGITLYGVYMNTFAGKDAFEKAHRKEAQRMIEEGTFDPNEVLEVEVPEDAEDGADI